jgi:hypothetical protein
VDGPTGTVRANPLKHDEETVADGADANGPPFWAAENNYAAAQHRVHRSNASFRL